jgi:hypothetical protein
MELYDKKYDFAKWDIRSRFMDNLYWGAAMGENNIEYSSLKDLTSSIDLNEISERVLEFLRVRFSEVQCASNMCLCDECKDRFVRWLKTGDDNEAWS